jgi:hypothetical protein
VRDNRATIDLRRRPTRADLGFRPGQNGRSYQAGRGVDAIDTTILLPTGTLHVPAFGIEANGDDFTHAGAAHVRQPEHIIVERTFADARAAARSLLSDASTLGVPLPDVEQLMGRVANKPSSVAPQQGVLDGLVRDWLAVWVNVIGQVDDDTVQVNYEFSINQFHNPAIDAVVHGGRFPIDLTHRPSRRELAFRDTYSVANVMPAWHETLTVSLTFPDSTVDRRVDSVVSSTTDDASGTGQPRRTDVSLVSASTQDAVRLLHVDAAALGLDDSAIEAIFAREPATRVVTALTGRATSAYDIEARIDANVGQPGDFAVKVTYVFTYH